MTTVADGIKDGLNFAMDFNDRIDAKRELKKTKARNEKLFGQQQEDRKYRLGRREVVDKRGDTQYQQSQEEYKSRLGRRGVLESRADTAYGQQQETYEHMLSRRGKLEGREEAQYQRQQQEYRLKDSARVLQGALAAYQAGNKKEAERLIIKADAMSGGQFANMAGGVNSRMAAVSEKVSTGQLGMDDPEFVDASRQWTQPTMDVTGRASKYRMDGLEKLADGRYAYKLRQRRSSALLDFIGDAEAPQGYNQVYGKNKSQPLDAMTLDEVFAYQDKVKQAGSHSAVGRYQIKNSTLKGLQKNLKLKGDEKFTPELQDRLGKALLDGRGYQDYKSGKITEEEFSRRLVKEWAGMPVTSGKNKGESHYKNIAGNKALVTPEALMQVIRAERKRVPATYAQTGDANDVIMAETLPQLIEKVQLGQAQERQFNEQMPDELLGMLRSRMAMAGMPSAAKQKWSKLNDNQLYEEGSGRVRGKAPEQKGDYQFIEGQGAFNKNSGEFKDQTSRGGVPDLIALDKMSPPQQNDVLLKAMPQSVKGDKDQILVMMEKMKEAETTEEKYNLLHEAKRSQWVNSISQALVSGDISGDDEANQKLKAISEQLKQAGIDDGAITAMVAEVVDNVGLDDMGAFLTRLEQEIAVPIGRKAQTVKKLGERHAAQKKETARQDGIRAKFGGQSPQLYKNNAAYLSQ